MKDRVGEVYEWTLDDDIIVIVRRHTRTLSNPDAVEWEARSLITTRVSWFTESWFDEKHGEYLRRIA